MVLPFTPHLQGGHAGVFLVAVALAAEEGAAHVEGVILVLEREAVDLEFQISAGDGEADGHPVEGQAHVPHLDHQLGQEVGGAVPVHQAQLGHVDGAEIALHGEPGAVVGDGDQGVVGGAPADLAPRERA
jgi:hypothetical protein